MDHTNRAEKELKRLYPLHSQTIQAVAHKFLAAREGTKEAWKKGHKNIRYPWKINWSSILNGWMIRSQSREKHSFFRLGIGMKKEKISSIRLNKVLSETIK